MQNQPLISVIIPTYNEEARIPVAIQSIVDQTYKNIEIIVVDDQSTDSTEKVIKEFIKKDQRIRYLKVPKNDKSRIDWRGVNVNAGCFARNFGMEHAKGEWIAFQDADDASLRNRIETQLDLATRYKAVCITTACVRFEEKWIGKELDAEKYLEAHKDIVIPPETIVEIGMRAKGVLMSKWFPHSYIPFTVKKWFPFARKLFFKTWDFYPGAGNSPFFKREVFEKVRYRKLIDRVWPAQSGRGTDRDFLFQVAETFKNSYSFQLPLYLWRVRGNYDPYPNWEKYIKK